MQTYPKKIAIIGAGGFAREFYQYLLQDQIRHKGRIEFFVSEIDPNNYIKANKLTELFPKVNEYLCFVAIADPKVRKSIVESMPKGTVYGNYIHSSVIIVDKESVNIGEGSIICPGCILTTNITIGNHSQLNLQTSIGHDCVIQDYFTTAPKVSISGNNEIGNCVYFGTNSSSKEKIYIGDNVKLGLRSGVVNHIIEEGTYIGCPTVKIN